VAVALALVVETATTVARMRLNAHREQLNEQPAAAAAATTSDPLLAWPAAVERYRLLPLSPLRPLAPAVRSAVSRHRGELQVSWMPLAPWGFTDLARAAAVDGQLSTAYEHVEAALARDPTSPYLHRVAAHLALNAGLYGRALDHLAEAWGLAPGNSIPPQVEVLPEDEDRVQLEGLRRRVRLYPRQKERTLLNLAEELRRRGRHEEARHAVQEAGDGPAAQLARARWALEEGDAETALALATPVGSSVALPRRVRAEALALVSRARAATGDTEGALAAARSATQLSPSSAQPFLALARLAEARGDTGEALDHLRRARGIDPANTSILLRLARLAEQEGAVPEARAALQRAVEIAPRDVRLAVELVELLLRHGEYFDAALTLSRQLDRHPTNRQLLSLAAQLPTSAPPTPTPTAR
jgi:tetratricopeptide (TPR) repeat protein